MTTDVLIAGGGPAGMMLGLMPRFVQMMRQIGLFEFMVLSEPLPLAGDWKAVLSVKR